MNRIRDTLQSLRAQAETHDEIAVGFSGGKDALVTLDLCCQAFKRVRAFFMYFVPGLKCEQAKLAIAKERWGVEVLQIPHWNFVRCLRDGIFCDALQGRDHWPRRSHVNDCYLMATIGMDKPLVAIGAKKSDSMYRRRTFKAKFSHDWLIAPLADWTKFDVLAYLKARNIPLPYVAEGGFQQSGLDLSTPEVLRLHDNHPDDYAELCRYFPYAEALVKRRQMYGVQ